MDAVYRAKTVGELAPLVSDLPRHPPRAERWPIRRPARAPGRSPRRTSWPSSAAPRAEAAGGSDAGRTPSWCSAAPRSTSPRPSSSSRRPPSTWSLSSAGGDQGSGECRAARRGAGCSADSTSLAGGRGPGRPVVVVSGFAFFGGVEAKPKHGKRLKNLRG
ncbi:hypothetical protein NKH77_33695 [Streptomyces sp. M19]